MTNNFTESLQITEFSQQSCDWFYSHVKSKCQDFRSAKVIRSVGFSHTTDDVMNQVRNHIEKVVETLVGENIDESSVLKLASDNSSYDRVFLLFHRNLSDALTQLAQAIYAVLSHHPVEPGKTPTEAHTGLKNLIDALVEEIKDDTSFHNLLLSPTTPTAAVVASAASAAASQNDNMFLAESYEDLLATAIINKLIILSKNSKVKMASNKRVSPVHGDESGHFSSTEDDLDSSHHPRSNGSSSGHSSSRMSQQTDSSGSQMSEGSLETRIIVQNESIAFPIENFDEDDEDFTEHHQYLIEEEIEEITEYINEEEGKSSPRSSSIIKSGPWLSSRPSMHSVDCILAEMNSEEENSENGIPFPEFGVDIVLHHKNESDYTTVTSSSSSSESEGDESEEKPQKSLIWERDVTQDWEENWLFRRKKPGNQLLSDDPVAMLVPLPNFATKAQIGEKDIDEISELSESKSVCSSVDSFEENDLEHTEYSVTPLIRSSISISRGSAKEMIRALNNNNEYKPKFLKIPEAKITCMAGNVVTFEAVTSGQKPIDVAWFRGPTLLEDNEADIEIQRHKDRHILRLYDIKKSSFYSCTALNAFGEANHQIRVTVEPEEVSVEEKAPSVDMEPKEEAILVEEGEAITLVCRVGGCPEPRLVFYKDDKRLRTNENISIDRDSNGQRWILQIRNCGPRQAGKYCAVAKNRNGTSSLSWQVQLQPSAEIVIDEHQKVEEMPLYPQSILKKPTEFPPVPFNLEDENDNDSLDIVLPPTKLSDFADFDRPSTKPGTIADREHRKWVEKAIPLTNNPYSKESLEKRLSKTSMDSGTSTLHSSVLNDNYNNRLISSPEGPRRIDCGPKLSNLRRYWRDYYVDPNTMTRMGTSSSSASSTSSEAVAPVTTAQDPKNYLQCSDSDGLHDSLDETVLPDSGVGSSSERGAYNATASGKSFSVTAEKKGIEKAKAIFEKKSSSTDSLLSMDEGSDNSSNPPALPPKGRFVSTDNLSRPPTLPPKQRPNSLMNKRISASTVCINNISDNECLTDGSVAERIKNFMSKASPEQPLKPMMRVRPRRSMQDLTLMQDNNQQSNKQVDDLPKELPSVRNLASIFNVPKKSPEPLPRRSLVKKQPSVEKKAETKAYGHQIHSLTARSVPRQFREVLAAHHTPLDKNIRLKSPTECHIIYDSQQKDLVPYPDAEFIRTPSPEHTGIPAVPVKMPPIRQKSPTSYTSDESNDATLEIPVKPMRRKSSNVTNSKSSVKSLVERYNC